MHSQHNRTPTHSQHVHNTQHNTTQWTHTSAPQPIHTPPCLHLLPPPLRTGSTGAAQHCAIVRNHCRSRTTAASRIICACRPQRWQQHTGMQCAPSLAALRTCSEQQRSVASASSAHIGSWLLSMLNSYPLRIEYTSSIARSCRHVSSSSKCARICAILHLSIARSCFHVDRLE